MLESNSTQRTFLSGSRAAHDPLDRFLEENGYYRKHTPRDKSSLFRAVSEQLYGSQEYHKVVRTRCVNYMREHYDAIELEFVSKKDLPFSKYIDNLAKSYTSGTLFELNIIGRIYCKSIYLFEAFNRGTWFLSLPNSSGTLTLFFTPERYFDSVFDISYVESVAFCQAICYEILYKDVYRLPDVSYAVERMLYDEEGACNADSKEKTDQVSEIYFIRNKSFKLDKPEKTNCILENSQLCHFHNYDFLEFTMNLEETLRMAEGSANKVAAITRTIDSLLQEKYLSCVRQLLDVGITPFPYKVAKALDEDIYRNVDFDAWNEKRKTRKSATRNGYFGNDFQMGEKCLVRLDNSCLPYECYIQDYNRHSNTFLVYIEELGEKRCIPYHSIRPMRQEYSRSYNLITNGNVKNAHHPLRQYAYGKSNAVDNDRSMMKSLMCLRDFVPMEYNYLTMPVLKNGENNKFVINEIPPFVPKVKKEGAEKGKDVEAMSEGKCVEEVTAKDLSMEHHCEPSVEMAGEVAGFCEDRGATAQAYAVPYPYMQPMPGVWSHAEPNNVPYVLPCANPGQVPFGTIQRVDLLRTKEFVNLAARPSFAPNGCDLPLNEIPTLRFFYNLGHEFIAQLQQTFGPGYIQSLIQEEPLVAGDNNPDNMGFKRNPKHDKFDNRKKNINKRRQVNFEKRDGSFKRGGSSDSFNKDVNMTQHDHTNNVDRNRRNDRRPDLFHKEQETPTGILGKRNLNHQHKNQRRESKDSSPMSEFSENIASQTGSNSGSMGEGIDFESQPPPAMYQPSYYYPMEVPVEGVYGVQPNVQYPYNCTYTMPGYPYGQPPPMQPAVASYPAVQRPFYDNPGVMALPPTEVPYEMATGYAGGYQQPQVMYLAPPQPVMNYWVQPSVMPPPMTEGQYGVSPVPSGQPVPVKSVTYPK